MPKYHNRKTTIDGIQFDSKAEGNYYLILKEKQRTGEIRSFTTQPRFPLQDAFKKNGKTYRKIDYIADFEVIHLDGSKEIIDVKGVKTEAFKIKHKLFEKAYPHLTLTIIDGRK